MTTSLMTTRAATGCSRSSSGRANFRKPYDDLIEAADLIADDRRRASPGSIGARAARRRRGTTIGCGSCRAASACSSSRWIVIALSGFFTSCATPAISRPERRQLARVVQRRVHLARGSRGCAPPASRRGSGRACLRSHGTSAAARRARRPIRVRAERNRHRALRATAGERALDQLPHRIARQPRDSWRRRPRRATAARRASRSWRTSARLPARRAPSRPRGCPSPTRSRWRTPATPGARLRRAAR